MPNFIDTHCHVNFKAFLDDSEEAIRRAQDSGVKKMLVVGTEEPTGRKAIEQARRFEGVWAAVSYHPIHVARLKTGDEIKGVLAMIETLAQDEKVKAVGETGLDYYREPFDKERQQELFRGVIEIARNVNKPLIIHSRQAGDDILQILEEKTGWRGVFHCFPGDWEMAEKVMALGFCLGFNGLITYSGDNKNIEVVKKMPLEKMVLETDSPYLTPVPKRGERNEPAYVKYVAEEVARLRNISLEEVSQITTKNAEELFGI